MSQRGLEDLLGRLITDKGFRRQFFEEPAARCAAERIEVTPRELDALLKLKENHIESFAKRLDPRIVRAVVDADTRARPRPRRLSAPSARVSGAK